MHQVENGFTRIANTLLEAIAQTVMSGACFRVLFWVIRNSYGYNRKITRPSSLRKMAQEINMTSSSVGLALQILIENGIIVKNEVGEMSLNKEKLSGVRETGRLQVSEKLDKSVRETGQSVRETGHPLIIKKDNLKDSKDTGFSVFWLAYPKKTGKVNAVKAWKKLKPPLDKCLLTLKWQVNSPEWLKEAGQYIPYPATWINAGQWQDVPNTHNLVTCTKCGTEGILPKSISGTPICRKCKDQEKI